MASDRAPHLTPVSAAALEAYPIPRGERLPELAWIKWYPTRWLFSSAHLGCSYEVQGVIRALFDLSVLQSPIGTLPDADEELAKLLRMDLTHWRALRGLREIGPMRGWYRVDCEGEVRMAHRVVLDGLQDVLERREAREATRSAQAEVKRLDRLTRALQARGFVDDIARNSILIRKLDYWLVENGNRKRTEIVLDRAIAHGTREGWFAPPTLAQSGRFLTKG